MIEFRSMSERENYLRTTEMRKPEWIPCSVYFLKAAWKKYREELEEIIVKYPLVFGDYERGSVDFDDLGVRRKGVTCTDDWGCVWNHLVDGLTGQVVRHPLQDWKAFENFKPPDLLDLGGLPNCTDLPQKPGRKSTDDWKKTEIREKRLWAIVPTIFCSNASMTLGDLGTFFLIPLGDLNTCWNLLK